MIFSLHHSFTGKLLANSYTDKYTWISAKAAISINYISIKFNAAISVVHLNSFNRLGKWHTVEPFKTSF